MELYFYLISQFNLIIIVATNTLINQNMGKKNIFHRYCQRPLYFFSRLFM